MIQEHEIARIEDFLVEFHDISAKHRLDFGMNEEFKVKLTSKDDSPTYSRNLSTPINLKNDILVELAFLHRCGIINTLPISKYASPIFTQKKRNGKLRLLVDLREINNLISDEYNNRNHPVSTLTDSAQHMAGKNSFANWIALMHIIAYRWPIKDPLKCLHLILQAQSSPTVDWPKALVESHRPFPALCVNIWTKSSKQTTVLKT